MSIRKSPTLTPAFLAAARENARKSTGPRTEAGKRRSMLNALKHGLRSRGFRQALLRAGHDTRRLDAEAQILFSTLLPKRQYEVRRVARAVVLFWSARRWLPRHARPPAQPADARRWEEERVRIARTLAETWAEMLRLAYKGRFGCGRSRGEWEVFPWLAHAARRREVERVKAVKVFVRRARARLRDVPEADSLARDPGRPASYGCPLDWAHLEWGEPVAAGNSEPSNPKSGLESTTFESETSPNAKLGGRWSGWQGVLTRYRARFRPEAPVANYNSEPSNPESGLEPTTCESETSPNAKLGGRRSWWRGVLTRFKARPEG